MANSSGLYLFSWHVPDGGYRWLRAHVFDGGEWSPRPLWVLTTVADQWAPVRQRFYPPLREHPALFQEFAALPHDRKAFQAFANKYGNLGVWTAISEEDPRRRDEGIPAVYGETEATWVEEARDLRLAIDLWELARKRNTAALAKLIRYQPPTQEGEGSLEGWVYETRGEGGWMRSNFLEPHPDITRPPDLIGPARLFVQRWVNEKLRNASQPVLLFDTDTGEQVLRVRPRTLLAAMWLQFAKAVEGNREYRACRECGGVFEISSERNARAAHAVFCSDKCKSRNYRRKRERAGELAAEGKTFKEIAAELGTDVATARKWAKARKGV